MKSEKSQENKLYKNSLKRVVATKLLYAVFVLLLLISLYHLVFAHRIIPGVYIGKVYVGSLTYNEAKKLLQDYITSNVQPIELDNKDYKYLLKPDDISLSYNIDASVTRAFEVGRTGNLLTDSKEKLSGFVKKLQVKAFYDVDQDALSAKFAQVQGDLNKPGQDAKFDLENNQVVLKQSSVGQIVDDKDLYNKIVGSLDDIDFSRKQLVVQEKDPTFTAAQLQSFTDQVAKIVANPFKITYGETAWELNSSQKLDLIDFSNESDKPDLTLNKNSVQAFIENLGQEVNQLPRGKVSQVDGDKVVKFEITQNGKEINTKKFTTDFKSAFLTLKPSVEVSTNDISTANNADKYGIYSLLGTGHSKYVGSIPGRIHNLNLAADRTDGVLVPPGAVYSFNKAVGEVSGKTGYNAAYVISNGRTVLGDGGGVCQTSTTLFRAVLNAGLPVITRFPHAYRVHYYEEESPIGFDASVFQPSLDFQFKNDTPNHVLIQAYKDIPNSVLEFRIFGTPDGRSVKISDPVVTNVSGAPAAKYQDDPTLPKGVVKQVDFAAGGANVSFTREVDRNGQVLFKDTFSSHYQPWQAIFLVGTKT
ncbi:MAG TPA: VanW family protein [Candidatus Saccharimonadales bacterium]|nr:VanW family protein [Candidatus Saccharimonadales bacterium]